MSNLTTGKTKQRLHRVQMWLCSAIGVWGFASCTNSYTTYTDTYYVANQTAEPIMLVLEQPIMWDTCSVANPQRVWYNSRQIPINTGKIIRIHPITREYKHMNSGDKMNISQMSGSMVLLIAGNDTIEWIAHRYDYVYGEEWSFFDSEDWITAEDKKKPYYFYHTFIIDQEKIERAKQ